MIEPKDIVFDKLMLLRKATKYISIRNISSLPLNWKIANISSLHPQLMSSITKGKVGSHSTSLLWLTYHATVVESVVKAFQIEVTTTKFFISFNDIICFKFYNIIFFYF